MTFPSMPPIILASASPRRAELLRELGVNFTIVTRPTEEAHHEDFTARELCLFNAYRKARAVAKLHPQALVLGADTLVYLGTKLYAKPADTADARRMLRELAGHTHQVVTGVCLLQLGAHRCRLFAETTSVTFKPLSESQIAAYLAAIQPLDKAGAYAIQDRGDEIVERISGSFSNVVGLPVERVKHELAQWRRGTAPVARAARQVRWKILADSK
ncbi:MAG: septum formation protein Maf [Verrucomicrobia bacterium]|nr:septum formation protein Maf [Verrucomicrobiota bacterium]